MLDHAWNQKKFTHTYAHTNTLTSTHTSHLRACTMDLYMYMYVHGYGLREQMIYCTSADPETPQGRKLQHTVIKLMYTGIQGMAG